MPTESTAADLQVLALDDADAVTAAVADLLVDGLGRAIVDRGEAVLALSGGSTPVPLYRHLATHELDWRRVHVVQVDERVAPDQHPDRSWRRIEDLLVVPTGAIGHPMPVLDGPAGVGAYAADLAALGGIDVCHLGLGDDGHTASLIPGDPSVAVRDADVTTAGPYEGRMRMTLTASAINRARRIVWQVVGSAKAPAVARLATGTGEEPSRLIRRSPDVWLVVDQAAGSSA